MIFDATVDGRTLRVEVRGKDGRYVVLLDGTPLEVDLQETGRHFVSLLIGGKSYEAGLQKRPGGYNVVLADDVVSVDLAEAIAGRRRLPARKARGPAAGHRAHAGEARARARGARARQSRPARASSWSRP